MLLTLLLSCSLWIDNDSLSELDQDADGVRYGTTATI